MTYNSATDIQPFTKYFIRKTKWSIGKVVLSDFGPFDQREDAAQRLNSLRKHKNSTYNIIEKENGSTQL